MTNPQQQSSQTINILRVSRTCPQFCRTTDSKQHVAIHRYICWWMTAKSEEMR